MKDDGYARYALYWAPDAGDPLGRFGAHWLGHDPAGEGDGTAGLTRLRLGLSEEMADRVTTEPRHYGLHATLKAPFRLAPGRTAGQLAEAVHMLATSQPPFVMPPLRLTAISRFLALCPSGPSPALTALAERCVIDLDGFRAPLSDGERARRKPQVLSPMQIAMLDRWGYPHVLSQFRFHITLTGRLSDDERVVVEPALAAVTGPFCREPFAITAVALFGDPGGDRPFRLLQRSPLGGVEAAGDPLPHRDLPYRADPQRRD